MQGRADRPKEPGQHADTRSKRVPLLRFYGAKTKPRDSLFFKVAWTYKIS